jgi:superfamily I DNA/RNA helicase
VVTAQLRLLGAPALVVAGRLARLHSAKVLALLAYLTLEANAPHSRAKLAALLWGESPDAQARHGLRQGNYARHWAWRSDWWGCMRCTKLRIAT